MLPYLDNSQLEHLQQVLETKLTEIEITAMNKPYEKIVENENKTLTASFISAKRIEGCSEKTLTYYENTISVTLSQINKNLKQLTTDDLRLYLTEYQEKHNSSRVTIDNIRRILSSFFSWLEDEGCIFKSPIRRIHKVKTDKVIKETYTDEELET